MDKPKNSHQEIIDWASSALGCSISKSEIVVNPAWSLVIRVTTEKGIYYLKQTPEKIGREAEIINTLRNTYNASVPEVVAINDEMHCFIMKDAGTSVRTILKATFNVDMVCTIADQFTRMQLEVAKDPEVLLELDVPNWGMTHLPQVFAELLDNLELLTADGIAPNEIEELKDKVPIISALCGKLAAFGIRDTIVQIDFNDNNVVVDQATGKYTHVDLGEIVISHPFFSLDNCLRQMTKHYNLTDPDEGYVKIKQALFKNYISIYGADTVNQAFAIARLLWNVNDALGQYRLIDACDRDTIMEFQGGKLGNTLRELNNVLEKVDLSE